MGSSYADALAGTLPYVGIGGISFAALLGILKSLQRPEFNKDKQKLPQEIAVKLPISVATKEAGLVDDFSQRLFDHFKTVATEKLPAAYSNVAKKFTSGTVRADDIFNPAHPNFWFTVPLLSATGVGSVYAAEKLMKSDKTESELELERLRKQFRRVLTDSAASTKTAQEKDDTDITRDFVDVCFEKCSFSLGDMAYTGRNVGLLALIGAAILGARASYADEKEQRQRTIEEAVRVTTARAPVSLSAQLTPIDEETPTRKFKPVDVTMAGTYKQADFMSSLTAMAAPAIDAGKSVMSMGNNAVRSYVTNMLSDPQFVSTLADKVFDNPAIVNKLTDKLFSDPARIQAAVGKILQNPDTRRAVIGQGWNVLKSEYPVLGGISDIFSGLGSIGSDFASKGLPSVGEITSGAASGMKSMWNQGWHAATGLVDSGAADKLFGGSGTAVPPGGAASGGGAAAASSSGTPSPIKT